MYVLLTYFRFSGRQTSVTLRGGGGSRPSVTLCDGGVGRALRVTPKYFICIISYYNLYIVYVLLTDFRFVGRQTSVTLRGGGSRAGVTLCDRGGSKLAKKSVT